MNGQTSGADVAACVSLAISLFAGSLIPFFLLVDVEHLVPRVVRELPGAAREQARQAALSAAALLLILTAPQKGALR